MKLTMSTFDVFFASKKHIGILLLRMFIGIRLIYGVMDNIVNWHHMIEFSNFLENHGFPIPLYSAILSVYAQFLSGLMLLFGYKTRVAAFIMSINFMVALLLVHLPINDTIEGMTPALAMLFGSLTLLFTGGDRLSLDVWREKV